MYTFYIPKMSCGGCANGIIRAVKSVDGNAKIEVDVGSKTVKVETVLPQAQVGQVMRQAGYPPSV